MRKDEDIKRIWFTGDLHLMHENILKYTNRNFSNIKEHDNEIIQRINNRVSKKDELYILGDVSCTNKAKTEKLLHKINGNKYLILGNHDNSIKNSTLFESIDKIKLFKFKSLNYNIKIVLCHFPMLTWENKPKDVGHLYGHVHGRLSNHDLSFDIGLDSPWTNFVPLNLEEVLNTFEKIKVMKEYKNKNLEEKAKECQENYQVQNANPIAADNSKYSPIEKIL